METAFMLGHHFGIATIVALWAWPALAVERDARRRLRDPRARRLAVAVAVGLPLVGPIMYGCLRPAETLEQRRERRLRARVLAESVEPEERCVECRTPVDPSFRCCPSCAAPVRRACGDCGTALKLHWAACPHCEAPADGRPALGLVA